MYNCQYNTSSMHSHTHAHSRDCMNGGEHVSQGVKWRVRTMEGQYNTSSVQKQCRVIYIYICTCVCVCVCVCVCLCCKCQYNKSSVHAVRNHTHTHTHNTDNTHNCVYMGSHITLACIEVNTRQAACKGSQSYVCVCVCVCVCVRACV
jgi:hypothetical protein